MTVILAALAGLALAWLIAAAARYRKMVDFRLNARDRADAFVRAARASGELDYPTPWLSGGRQERGLVMCAGGPSLLAQAWTNLDVLRGELGCTLPIVLYYVGPDEMSERCRRLFEERFDGLTCVDIQSIPSRPHHPARDSLVGFETKPFVLLNAPFDEVVFIDADSIPLEDPARLFDLPSYREHGHVFWPDNCLMSTLVPHPDSISPYSLTDGRDRQHIQTVNVRIFDHYRLPRPSAPDRVAYETESGQIVVDRRRCFDAIQTAFFLCSEGRYIQLYSYGDTLMYRLAFGIVGRPFNQIPRPSHHAGVIDQGVFRGKAMLPVDETGQPRFLHQMHRKPSLVSPFEPLTHVTRDAAIDHPRRRDEHGVTLLAREESLADLRPVDDRIAKLDDRIRVSLEELGEASRHVDWPVPPKRSILGRRILPW